MAHNRVTPSWLRRMVLTELGSEVYIGEWQSCLLTTLQSNATVSRRRAVDRRINLPVRVKRRSTRSWRYPMTLPLRPRDSYELWAFVAAHLEYAARRSFCPLAAKAWRFLRGDGDENEMDGLPLDMPDVCRGRMTYTGQDVSEWDETRFERVDVEAHWRACGHRMSVYESDQVVALLRRLIDGRRSGEVDEQLADGYALPSGGYVDRRSVEGLIALRGGHAS